MDYKYFYNLLEKARLITPIWKYELELIEKEIDDINKDYYLGLFCIYFSLINSGNACMSLNKNILNDKWNVQINGAYKQLSINLDFDINIFDDIKKISNELIDDKYLLNIINLDVVSKNINDNKIFEIDDNYLYLKKYNHARLGIIESIKRLFNFKDNNEEKLNIDNDIIDGKRPNLMQREAIKKGLNNNLIITGGPGTGKTTSILFILLNILMNDKNSNYNIYLAAASGKAASRMKESLLKGINDLSIEFKSNEKNKEIINKIVGALESSSGKKTEEFTIHRLLGIDKDNNKFKYNNKNQFDNNSIFVIDEASMIDICIFDSLLKAIKEGSRIFILGDKDQLPSVEVGAVFSDLLNALPINNKVALTESMRFKDGTVVANFAKAINNNLDLGIKNEDFMDPNSFIINDVIKGQYPIYYYLNDGNLEEEKIKGMVYKWINKYYLGNDNIVNLCSNLDKNNVNENELSDLIKFIEKSKIICAENEGIHGVNYINNIIKRRIYESKDNKINNVVIEKSFNNNYAGQIMMISKNNKILDLYNGDSGILVNFKDDNTLYLMVNKETKLGIDDTIKEDKIFKIGKFVFYPFRMIKQSEIQLAYAISVHKSQGSDYESIFVFLPNVIGHPLLNRQILYTAITRTKGNTYIYSNLEMLNEAKSFAIIRDTNIKL